MVLFGSVFGALMFYFEECSDYFGIADATWITLVAAMVVYDASRAIMF